jgi:hypothetical protein
MTFEEWWGGDRDRTLAYDLMKVLTEAARQAWDAATKAAQPQWRPMESAPKDGTPFLAHWNAEELPVVASFRDGYFRGLDGDSDPMMLLGWMPLPPELGQEARDVT